MPIWKTAPVTDQPEIVLTQWSVREVTSDLWEGPSRHFVGYNNGGYEGRVSSQIVSFDKKTMCGVTRSGRVYKLVGTPGYNSDAEYVWNWWASRNKVTTEKEVKIMSKKKGGGKGCSIK